MAGLRDVYLKMTTNGPDCLVSTLLFVVLYPFSILFSLIVKVRTRLYLSGCLGTYQANVPVISVGNLTVGGTGKTPVVDSLVKWFIAHDVKTAVVSRGYGGTYRESFLRVDAGNDSGSLAQKVGDEPYLLADKNPKAMIFVARDRRLGVKAAESDGAECIILDDAFQHHKVARDCNIVLLDACHPFGNGALLPAGPLREGKAALDRADLLVMTRAKSSQELQSFNNKPLCRCFYCLAEDVTSLQGEPVPMSQLSGLKGVAFAGIASPESFFGLLQGSGLDLAKKLSLADHCNYDAEQLADLAQQSVGADYLITTEKDAVKLSSSVLSKVCYVARLELAFENEEPLLNRLQMCLDRVVKQRENS